MEPKQTTQTIYNAFQKTVESIDDDLASENVGRTSLILKAPIVVTNASITPLWARAERYLDSVPMVAQAYTNLELDTKTIEPAGLTFIEQQEYDRRLLLLQDLLDKLDADSGEGSFSDYVMAFDTPWRHQAGQVHEV